MGESAIQRLFTLLGFTLIPVVIQYFIVKVVVKDSIKKQILSNVFITLIWYVSAMYSFYKEYRNLFVYVFLWLVIAIIVNSVLSIKGRFYDSRKIKSKYKTILIMLGFVFIGLFWLDVVNMYLFLTVGAIVLLLIYFIDYKNHNNYDENNIK